MSEERVSKVEVVQTHGMTMIGRGESNHWVVMDGPEQFRGHEAATRPMELLLISLGSCTGMDVISLMDKMHVPYNRIRLEITYERAQEHPKYYTKIHIHYIIYGKGLPIDKVEKAITLSQTRYCSVSYMLGKSSELTYDYEIREKEEEKEE